MKKLSKVLILAGMALVLMLPVSGKAEPPLQCPCHMEAIILKLTEMLRTDYPNADQQLSRCQIFIDNHSTGSGERWESAEFYNFFMSGNDLVYGVGQNLQIDSIGAIGKPNNSLCNSYIVDGESGAVTEFSAYFGEGEYDACKSEWLHLVNLYNTTRPDKSCPRDAINSFRNEEGVNFDTGQ